MKARPWPWLKILGSLLALGLLGLWVAQQDWATLRTTLSRVPMPVLVAAGGLYGLGQVANARRWYVLLRGSGLQVSWGKALRLTFAGAFASNFLPSTVGGDALRVSGLSNEAVPPAAALSTVMADRLLNVTAMYSFAPLTWATYGTHLLAGTAAFTAPTRGGLQVGSSVGGARLSRWLRAKFDEGAAVWRALWRSPRVWGPGLGWAWVSLLLPFTATWLMAQALGIPVGWYQVAGTTVITYTLTLLPIALNGYGVREVSMTTLYTILGATPIQAIALALLTRFLMATATLPGAFWLPEAWPQSARASLDSRRETQ